MQYKEKITVLVKLLTVLIWLVPVAFGLMASFIGFLPSQGYVWPENLHYALTALELVFGLYTLGFLVAFPYWIPLIAVLLFVKRRTGSRMDYLYFVVFGFDVFILLLTVFLLYLCSLSSLCREEGWLTSGSGVIIACTLGLWFGTLSFASLFNQGYNLSQKVLTHLKKRRAPAIHTDKIT